MTGRCETYSRLRYTLGAVLIVLVSVLALHAQNDKHASPLKTVRGVVTDKADNPINGAVVFLKNVRTNQVRSNITNEQGNYRFSGIDPNAEYELYAEKDNAKSQVRNISSFENRLDIVLNLKLDKKK
jgi:Carboxypeptidase regulatory-like domain